MYFSSSDGSGTDEISELHLQLLTYSFRYLLLKICALSYKLFQYYCQNYCATKILYSGLTLTWALISHCCFSFFILNLFAYTVPMQYWKYWKSTECWIQFSRPWKSIEFGQNVHKLLKKYVNSKFSHLLIQIVFFTTYDSSADVFALCSINKIFAKWS